MVAGEATLLLSCGDVLFPSSWLCWISAGHTFPAGMQEGEYGILPAMVKMPFCSCYSKEAGKCCQVTAVFNKSSQVSGAEEKGRLISPGSAWLVCGSSRALCTGCWHTQCPGAWETPVMGPKPSEIPQPWPSLVPAARSLLPALAQQGVGRWPWRAPICRDPGVPLPPSHHLA